MIDITRAAICFSVAVAGIAATGCGSRSGNLSGHIDMDRDTLLIRMTDATGGKSLNITDTVVLKDGFFSISVPDSSACMLYFAPKPGSENEMMTILPARILFLPGDRMKVDGTIDDLHVSGTELYDALSRASFWKEESSLNVKRQELRRLYSDPETNKTAIDSLKEALAEADSLLTASKMEFIRKEPANIASGYAALMLPAEECVEAGRILDSTVLCGKMKPVLDYILEANRQSIQKRQNWERLVAGSKAPDFSLRNLDGEYMNLESFRGRYVLLDFWGTWCGWCIKGIPDMKEYYGRYHEKIEFVGICCRDSEERWREGVQKYGLPWTNLYNGYDTDIILSYGIQGYPSKVLIGPDGTVVDKFLGESQEMYDTLDRLF